MFDLNFVVDFIIGTCLAMIALGLFMMGVILFASDNNRLRKRFLNEK